MRVAKDVLARGKDNSGDPSPGYKELWEAVAPILARRACVGESAVGQLHHGSNDETSEENEDDVGRARALLQ